MAILNKRKSSKSLPTVSQATGPIVSTPAPTTTTSATPKIAKQTAGATPSAKLTSAIKAAPEAGKTAIGASKPALAATPTTRAGTITSAASNTNKPTVSTTTGSSGSSSALTSALTGALAGAGAKYVYDKVTGAMKPTTPVTPKVTPKVPTLPSGTKLPTTPTTPKVPSIPGVTTPKQPTAPKAPTTTKSPTAATKPGAGSTTGAATTPGLGGATEIENTAQEGDEAFGWKYYSDGTAIDPQGNYYKNGELIWSPETQTIENTAQEGEEGYGWQYFSDGTAIDPDGNYYKDGQMIWSPETGDVTYEIENTAQEGDEGYGWQYFSDGTAIDPDGNYYQNGELIYSATGNNTYEDASGNFTYVDDEGYTMVYDANGNIISYDNPSYNITPEVTDDTYTYVDEQGYTMVYDGQGNIISYDNPDYNTDDSGSYTGADGNEYYIDELGNYYDAEGNLIWSPEETTDTGYEGWTQEDIDNYVYTDEYGNQYDFYGNLTYENTDYFDPNYVYTDESGNQYDWNGNLIYDASSDSTDAFDPYQYASDNGLFYDESTGEFYDYTYDDTETEDTSYDYTEDPYYWVKDGGSITMMKNGGNVRHFEDGGDVSLITEYDGWQYYSDGTAIGPDGSYYYQGELIYDPTDYGVDTSEVTEVMPQGEQDFGGWRYFSDGTSISPEGDYYLDGELVYSADTGEEVVNEIENTAQEGEEAFGWRYFSDGTAISPDGVYYKNGEEIYNPGTITGIGNTGGGGGVTGAKTPQQIANENLSLEKLWNATKGAVGDVAGLVSNSGYLGAGAAGAVLGALLSDSSLFGSTGQQNKGVDMTKVGVIPARTTTFGVGPANYVTYDQYGARDEMPDLYGQELLKNLNAPGANPVNEGDYGYEETEATDQDAGNQTTGMADGGLAGSYYTFGKTVDPLENLTNPQPAQQMPTQVPQMGGLQAGAMGGVRGQTPMPFKPQQAQMQQAPAMRKGGLPALSNVPLAEGRLDFRKGAPVHGPGDGQSDDIPAMLADGEYVIDAETVAQIGNGSTKAGAKALDEFRQNIRKHKRSAPLDKIPPKTKTLTSYLKKGK